MPKPGSRAWDRIILDTSAYSRLRTGHAELQRLLSLAEVIGISTVSLGELEAGFRMGSRFGENRYGLDEFLTEQSVAVLDITKAVSARYGLLAAELKRLGSPMPTNDVWIAAAALNWGGHLISFDRDFTRVPGLLHTLLA